MMNIKRAKQEIKDAVEAYLFKDEDGEYLLPILRQRPLLLLGAPGIGKTQIMEQVARECSIALVSYTITHHTRQSAIGLPFIAKKCYGGREYSVTEYTMSEIVASIYDKMEETGLQEGILFLDEINCVSETLSPAMLQFLQYKTFGNHAIPKGWVIVAAGNPPEYNKSVREFDVVTLDRLKKIEVEPDYPAWKEYASREGIHPAFLSYLNLRTSNFYKMETTVDGRQFVTPRGWEDLSRILKIYEKLGKKADEELIIQYLQHGQVAKDFAAYLELYENYESDYQVEKILSGEPFEGMLRKLAHAGFDERLSVVGLLLSGLNGRFQECYEDDEEQKLLFGILRNFKERLASGTSSGICFTEAMEVFEEETQRKRKADLLTRTEEKRYQRAGRKLRSFGEKLRKSGLWDSKEGFQVIKEAFDLQQDESGERFERAAARLESAFDFMEAAFQNSQEMVAFLSELNSSFYSVWFLKEYPCERYYTYNQNLLLEEKTREIMRRIREL